MATDQATEQLIRFNKLDYLKRKELRFINTSEARLGKIGESEGAGREDKFRGWKKSMKNRQIDNKSTRQVRIDAGLHKLLKIRASEAGMTIKAFLEDYLAEVFEVLPPDKK